MKIDSIQVENFGQFGNKRFRFEGQPLVLIYGANESGKTTTLNAIRQALFGFPRQSAYITGKMMSAEANVTLSDNRRVKFVRQKKNSDGFHGTIDGKIPISESEWQSLIGGLDLKSYQSLFGFTLDELRSGEKALAHAPIEQALSAGGLGGLAQLQKVQARIDGYLSQSLKRVGTSGLINAKLAEIDAAEKELESSLTLPADVTALRTRLANAQTQASQLQSQIQTLRQQLLVWQRRQAALPRAVELRQVEQSLTDHAIPAAIDDDFRMAWNLNTNKQAGVRQSLGAEQARLKEIESSLLDTTGADTAPDADSILPNHARWLELAQQARSAAEWRRQLGDDAREITELERELGETLRRIGLSIQDSTWRKIQIDLAEQAEMDTARQSIETLQHQLSDCHTRIDMAEKQLRMHRRSDATISAGVDLSEFENALRQARPILQQAEELVRRVDQLEHDPRWQRQSQQLLERTRPMVRRNSLQDFRLNPEWAVPSSAEVARYDQLLSSCAQQIELLSRDVEDRTQQCAALEREAAQSRSLDGLKTLADLQSMWAKRDQIIEQWREELRTPLLAQAASPAEVELRLASLHKLNSQADGAVCTMLAAVDRLANIAAQERQCEEARRQVQLSHEQLTNAKLQTSRYESEWNGLWKELPIEPQTPAQMNAWLDEYRLWQTQARQLESMKHDLHQVVAARDNHLLQLKNCWPVNAPTWSTPGEAEQCLGRLRNEQATWRAQQKMLGDLEATHRQSIALQSELREQLLACQDRLTESVRSLGLPGDWPAVEISNRLETVKRCQKLAVRLDALRERHAKCGHSLAGFVKLCQKLAAEQGTELKAELCEQFARQKLEQSSRALDLNRRRQETLQRLEIQKQRVLKLNAQLGELDTSLADMIARAGAESKEELAAWIAKSATVFQLRARKAQLKEALAAGCAGQPLDEFLAELSQLEARTVTAETSRLTAQLTSLEASASQAEQELGGIARELEFKEQGSAALVAEQKLGQLRSELVELSEQWIVHRLAGELLQRTIDQFTRDNEPQLIKHTRRFLKELTEDRYCMVEHDSGKHGGFAVRDQQGHAWQPDKLSTGTREQLYLAIRLAFITHYNAHNEPLPVIMDDCFVNFDDTRARSALRTLIHWHESVQTVLLSCHWRSVEALAELAPEAPVVMISTGEVTSARQLAERNLLGSQL